MSEHHSSDRSAAYTGLVLGAIALAIAVYSIVRLTNSSFERGEAATPGVVVPK